MDLKQSIRLKQQQKLVMSPRMLQSLNILRMPLLELRGRLQQEVLANPAIEECLEKESLGESPSETVVDYLKKEEEWEEYYKSFSHRELSDAEDREISNFEFFSEARLGLREHLMSQLHISGSANVALGEFIIGNIDDNGYLCMRTDEIAAATGEQIDVVENAVLFIQTFDPPGVCARDLRECLLIQAAGLKQKNLLAEKIIDGFLPELQKKQLSKIKEGLNVGAEEVAAAAKFISGLDPYPGASFSVDGAAAVSPDVIIKKEGGEYGITINEAELPRLRISRFYRNLLQKGAAEQTIAFIEKKIKSAEWILSAVESRKSSLKRVAEYILDTQKGFFEGRPEGINPVRMKDAAKHTGLSESTVSRAVSGKYIETSGGIYPMKYFFSGEVDSDNSNKTSSVSVKDRIAEIIRNEAPAQPLSDSGITGILKEEGINIARRTVAKYREAEGILPAALRKAI